MKKIMSLKLLAVLAAALLLSLLFATYATAQGITDLDGLVKQASTGVATPALSIVALISYLIGIACAFIAVWKGFVYSNNPQDQSSSVSKVIMIATVGVLFLGLPTVAGIGVGSLFGGANKQATVSGGGF